ncbi:MAG: hypothetical protein MMC23_007135 [Stictis urceolatum]|nr:hypothetical protein [Stictis urceolata]
MAKRLLGRIAIVTGSSSGLGQAISLLYAQEGARVVCADLRPDSRPLVGESTPPIPTHEAIQQAQGIEAAIFVQCNAGLEKDIKYLIAKTVEWGGRLDIMVCNAGISTEIASGRALRLHNTPVEDFDRTHAVNARGVWLGNKYAIAQMLEQEPLPPNYRGDRTRGWIINTASVYGLVAAVHSACYAPTKHTVIGITQQVALDYAKDRIHCNALCPGYIGTALIDTMLEQGDNKQNVTAWHPWGTLGLPEDIARGAVFLASDDS